MMADAQSDRTCLLRSTARQATQAAVELAGCPSARRRRPMADRRNELKETAAQCLALAHSTTDPCTRAALLTIARKLYDRATKRADDYEAAQREFNDRQMLPQSPMQQQQQIQPKRDD